MVKLRLGLLAYGTLPQISGLRVGTSIGAVTGAILARNAPEDRLPKLNQFWAEAMVHTLEAPTFTSEGRQIYNGLHTALTLMFGRPSIFRDRPIGFGPIRAVL